MFSGIIIYFIMYAFKAVCDIKLSGVYVIIFSSVRLIGLHLVNTRKVMDAILFDKDY